MPDTDIQTELERNDAAAAEVGLDVDVEVEAEIGVALLQVDVPPLDPADAILTEVRERDLRLEKLRTAAIKSRKEQTAAFLELLTRVEQLCADIPERGEQIAVMTRDWRMSRADTVTGIPLTTSSPVSPERPASTPDLPSDSTVG